MQGRSPRCEVQYLQTAFFVFVLKVGFRAVGSRKPRQVRKEAAADGLTDVPRSCLAGAKQGKSPVSLAAKTGCTA